MNKLNQFKGYAPYVAAICCLIYEAFSLAWGGAFVSSVIFVAILVAGGCCLLEKQKADFVGLIALAVASVFSIIDLVLSVIEIIGFIAQSYPAGIIVQCVLWLIPDVIVLLAVIALTAIVLLCMKKKPNVLTKFWYGPAALVVVGAIITFIFGLLFYFIFNDFVYVGDGVLGYFLSKLGRFLVNLALAGGFAGIGMNAFSKINE